MLHHAGPRGVVERSSEAITPAVFVVDNAATSIHTVAAWAVQPRRNVDCGNASGVAGFVFAPG
jgi:hypothetical protein